MAELSPGDIEEIHSRGKRLEDVQAQIERFRQGAPFLNLIRPCTVGDGIRRLTEEERRTCLRTFERLKASLGLIKFVPASGAASRMFRDLLKIRKGFQEVRRDLVKAAARTGDGAARQVLAFMENIGRFAFYEDLKAAMAGAGVQIEEELEAGEFARILDYLMTGKGLNYAHLPKGLLKFHGYPAGARTAFEEHLVEAVGYDRSGDDVCRLHFTVSQAHLPGFEALVNGLKTSFEEAHGTALEVDFSFQDPLTDTIAVDLENRPFRSKDGGLLFRPGGHGALIGNLSRLHEDVIFIKNIDNVTVDRMKGPTIEWKKILAGYLLDVQRKVFHHLGVLKAGAADDLSLASASRCATEELGLALSPDLSERPAEERRAVLLDLLDRPLRVCGMVQNVGEPGGGPFWVRGSDGRMSRQIVETAQVDPDSPGQREILGASTHFNPVDIVCAVKDSEGQPFDLHRFVNPEAVLISRKSKEGRDLKALELPGLWNGGMAGWNTIFVEVPLITFNPVKTIMDLLREPHQPAP